MTYFINTITTAWARFLLVGCSILLTGACASSRPALGPMSDISFPPLNAPATASLGERLLEQGRGFTTDVIKVHSLRGKFVSIQNETFCRAAGSDKFISFNGRAVTFLNFLGGVRATTNKVTFKEQKGQVCLKDVWSGCFGADKSSFDYSRNATCSSPNALQQVIEYNGKQGDTLNFTYRAFYQRDMMAENTQNFTMDLSVGDVFSYKGARIQVENASNQEISYRVLRNFNQR